MCRQGGHRTLSLQKLTTVPNGPFAITFVLLLVLFYAVEAANSNRQPVAADQCVEVICPLGEKSGIGLMEDKSDLGQAAADNKCQHCKQCTRNGYSVCVQPVVLSWLPNMRSTFLRCKCAHSGPIVRLIDQQVAANSLDNLSFSECRLPVSGGRPISDGLPNPGMGEGIYRLCFSSALPKVPKPEAKKIFGNDKKMTDVLVTVNQFWHSNNWKGLKPIGLRLFYAFPVAERANCEGKATVPSVEEFEWIFAGKSNEEVFKQMGIWMCTSSLPIYSEQIESAEIEKSAENEESAKFEYDDGAPEVIFERQVFYGANKVRLFYEVTVQLQNQLSMSTTGNVTFGSRTMKVSSEHLDFDLNDGPPKKVVKNAIAIEVYNGIVAAASGRNTYSSYFILVLIMLILFIL